MLCTMKITVNLYIEVVITSSQRSIKAVEYAIFCVFSHNPNIAINNQEQRG
ncbi:protein of unknown function [Moritella yayanosii]|uniref:Uncharacterized protein n=1 Tax=Moritella yayanosii TaxID=69539 RepID=A0A330LW32_9GAMM|nr:protein of unknown function [Moritella yayanosii]